MPDTPGLDISYALKLTPAEAVEYFRAKHIVITDHWRDLWQHAHPDPNNQLSAIKREFF